MTTLSASLDIIDLSDGVLTKSAEGQRTIVTKDAADLPLLTLEPVYGESVQDGTPAPDSPKHISCVRTPNLLSDSEDMASWSHASACSIVDGVATLNGSSSNWNADLRTVKLDTALLDGTTQYILSFDYSCTENCTFAPFISGSDAAVDSVSWSRTRYTAWIASFVLPASGGKWRRVVINPRTIAVSQLTSGSGDVTSFFAQLYARSDTTLLIRHVQIEIGTVTAGYTPSGHVGIVSTGKNLLDPALIGNGTSINGITWTVDNGTVSAVGTATATAQYQIYVPRHVYGNLWFSGCPNGGSGSTYDIYVWDLTTGARCKKHDGTTTAVSDYTGAGAECQIIEGHRNTLILRVMSGKTVDIVFRPQLEYGAVKTDFEPYEEHITYLDLQSIELHRLDLTYRDVLTIDASGHVTIEKRTGEITIDDIDQVGTATTGIYYFAKNSLRIAPEANGTTPTRAKSNMFAANQWSGSWYADKIFVNPSTPKPQFTHSNSSATTLAAVKTAFAGFECVYPLQEVDWYTIDLGYVDLPMVTNGSTVYVAAEIQPVIGGSWWTQAGLAAGEAFKDNRDEDWASRLMVTNAQMAIDKINGQIQSLVSGLDGMTTLTQTDSGFEFTVDDSLTSLLNGLQTDYNSLIHDLGVVVGNHTTELGVLSNYVQVTTENNQPVLRLGSSSNPVVAVLTNTGLEFRQSDNGTESVIAYLVVDDDGRGKLKVNTAVVLDTLQFGNWEWYTRPNGNMSIRWIGE